MESTGHVIAQEDRTLAALTHLSGLSGYVIPLGGVLVPDHHLGGEEGLGARSPASPSRPSSCNAVVFVLVVVTAILWVTIILIPLVLLFWCALALVALALPIVGAIKANQGELPTGGSRR